MFVKKLLTNGHDTRDTHLTQGERERERESIDHWSVIDLNGVKQTQTTLRCSPIMDPLILHIFLLALFLSLSPSLVYA